MFKKAIPFALAFTLALAGCGSSGTGSSGSAPADEAPRQSSEAPAQPEGEQVEIRMAWWGGNDRNAMMNAVLDLYEQTHPGKKVTREYTGWGDYWTKFATQAATGTAPDVAPLVMMNLAEYVNKGVVMPLDELVSAGKINLGDFQQAAIDSGRYKDKLYMAMYGMTVNSVLYNKTVIEGAGMELPPEKWTMAEMKDYCLALKDKLPEGVYVFESNGGYEHTLETYMRSKGKSLYNADGTGFGFDKADLIEYWNYWEELRNAGVTPSAQVAAEAGTLSYEESYLANGKSAMLFQNANLLKTYAAVSQNEIGITTSPTYDGTSGDFLQPTGFCIMNNTKLADEAAALIDWIVNDTEGNLLFKGDLGMPGSKTAAAALAEQADEPTKRFYDFMNADILPVVKPTEHRAEGSSSVMNAYKLKYEEVASGLVDVNTAVDAIFEEAAKLLAK